MPLKECPSLASAHLQPLLLTANLPQCIQSQAAPSSSPGHLAMPLMLDLSPPTSGYRLLQTLSKKPLTLKMRTVSLTLSLPSLHPTQC